MLTELRLYTVGELTHMRSMCVGVAETGVKHCSPAKIHKDTIVLSYFCVTKSTKSQQGGLALSSFRTTVRRVRVSRASHAWQVRAIKDKVKVGGFALSAILTIPRVRTHHTKKPSRFVHALSARPLKNGWRGRDSSTCADGKYIFFAFSVGYAGAYIVGVGASTTRTILQARKAQAPTRIYCCVMSGYGEPRGRYLGAIIGKPVR